MDEIDEVIENREARDDNNHDVIIDSIESSLSNSQFPSPDNHKYMNYTNFIVQNNKTIPWKFNNIALARVPSE